MRLLPLQLASVQSAAGQIQNSLAAGITARRAAIAELMLGEAGLGAVRLEGEDVEYRRFSTVYFSTYIR